MISDNWHEQLENLEKQKKQLKVSHLKGLFTEADFIEHNERIEREEQHINQQ